MKKKRNIVLVFSMLIIFVVGAVIAYFSNGLDFLTGFGAEPFNTTVTERFISPQHWKPGDVTDKQVIATNNNDFDVAVRLSYTQYWTTANGDVFDDPSDISNLTTLNFDNTDDWIKYKGYYYYKKPLSKDESTSSFLESVSFNSFAEADASDCSESEDGSEITCVSSGNGYDNARYTLTFNIEFAQYDGYQEIWDTDFVFGGYYPTSTFADYIIERSYSEGFTTSSSSPIDQMHTFTQAATFQTPALTDYRYIGQSPNNYIYFNCTDETDNSTCEKWRIIGVFPVEDLYGNIQQRVKIISDSILETTTSALITSGTYYEKLNSGTYWQSLSTSAKSMISTSKYYKSEIPYNYYQYCSNKTESSLTYYNWERNNSSYMFNKIALMYPSDYFFTFNDYYDTSWMYQSNKYPFTISSKSNNGGRVLYLSTNCVSSPSSVSSTYSIRPVLYLSENTEYISGDGSSGSPYKVGIKSFNINIPDDELISAPETAAIESEVTININAAYQILSFKLNGKKIDGNTFVMPHAEANITDIHYIKVKNIITYNDPDVIIQGEAEPGETVTINVNSDAYSGVASFKVNDEKITGNSFVMPEGDVIISDVEKIAYPVVESEHYPYPSSQSFALVYENTFEGAKSITLQISYQFYFSSSGIYIYNSSSASNYSYLTRFYGTQSSITDTTYTVNGNYVKIKFSSSTYTSTYANYYGYRIKVIPNYE